MGTYKKSQLRAQVKETGTAWMMFWFLACPYGYLDKWGLQILFWITLGGVGLWWFITMFRLGGMVAKYNADIYDQIDEIEKQEKREDEERHMRTLAAIKS